MKQDGFTLIELLAVIVILAVIALIASPIIVGLIDDARKEAFKDSSYGIVKAGEIYYSKSLLNGTREEVRFTYTNGVESSSVSGKSLDYNGSKPESGNVFINSKGQVAIAVYNGKYCSEKGYEDSEITLSAKTKAECKIFICGEDLIDDRDNSVYTTVALGEQCWMAEDLRYDCSAEEGKNYINALRSGSWSSSNYCASQMTGYGYTAVLYQWGVAMNGSTTPGAQGLCPNGWHIPTDAEWNTLEMGLGMTQTEADKSNTYRGTNQGDQLKELITGLSPAWCKSATDCDKSNFNAKPAGGINNFGADIDVNFVGNWWTSTISSSSAWSRYLHYNYSGVSRNLTTQNYGLSVRCVWNKNL